MQTTATAPTFMQVFRSLRSTAQAHADRTGNSSAELCISDANCCIERGRSEYAPHRLLKSLAHSVGIFHPDYQNAKRAVEALGSNA